jgi:hypothetical protein
MASARNHKSRALLSPQISPAPALDARLENIEPKISPNPAPSRAA